MVLQELIACNFLDNFDDSVLHANAVKFKAILKSKKTGSLDLGLDINQISYGSKFNSGTMLFSYIYESSGLKKKLETTTHKDIPANKALFAKFENYSIIGTRNIFNAMTVKAQTYAEAGLLPLHIQVVESKTLGKMVMLLYSDYMKLDKFSSSLN